MFAFGRDNGRAGPRYWGRAGPLRKAREMSNEWDESVEAWIAAMGSRGDYTREHVLDAPVGSGKTAHGWKPTKADAYQLSNWGRIWPTMHLSGRRQP